MNDFIINKFYNDNSKNIEEIIWDYFLICFDTNRGIYE